MYYLREAAISLGVCIFALAALTWWSSDTKECKIILTATSSTVSGRCEGIVSPDLIHALGASLAGLRI
ncbi:TGB3 [Senna mosaic virus]|uniref:TGB3 n=1 Tax=Senna mosaic virus TaxID=1881013 RepID=A0A1B1V3J5_9VIRU|nr:TGB3 [Senna mosaic virus]ANW11495.1 TGB3 [Senna mosaic virus]